MRQQWLKVIAFSRLFRKFLRNSEDEKEIQELSAEQKETIDLALDQIEYDQVLSDEEVKKELDQWFKQ